MACNLDLAYPRIGDDVRLDRRGNVRGFPRWTLGHDDASTVVAAYKQGSAARHSMGDERLVVRTRTAASVDG
jgi:hypothetical protein